MRGVPGFLALSLCSALLALASREAEGVPVLSVSDPEGLFVATPLPDHAGGLDETAVNAVVTSLAGAATPLHRSHSDKVGRDDWPNVATVSIQRAWRCMAVS